MRPESLFFELGVIFGVDVGRGQHHVDIVRGQSSRAFRPVVDDLERTLESFLAVDGIRLGVEPAVGHQACDASDPHIDAYTDFGIPTGRRYWQQQRLRRVDRLGWTGGGPFLAARPLAEIDDSVSIQTVAHQGYANQKNKNPSTSLNLHRHTNFLPCCLAPGVSVLICLRIRAALFEPTSIAPTTFSVGP